MKSTLSPNTADNNYSRSLAWGLAGVYLIIVTLFALAYSLPAEFWLSKLNFISHSGLR